MKRILIAIIGVSVMVLSVGALAQDKSAAKDREQRIEQLYKSGQFRTLSGKVIRMTHPGGRKGRMNRGWGMEQQGGMGPDCYMPERSKFMDGPREGRRPPRGRMSRVVMLVNTGEAIVPVMLGPSWYLKQSGLVALSGDDVTVEGSIVQLGNKPMMLATKIKAHGSELILRDEKGLPVWPLHKDRDGTEKPEKPSPKSDKQ
jgi:hypothetical protein